MSETHSHELADMRRVQSARLRWVFAITATFFTGEFVGAFYARSKVLRADALHMLMDVLALGLSLAAMRIASRPPSSKYTFGLYRAEPLAAVVNGSLILLTVVEIARDGFGALFGTEPPQSKIMLIVAGVALVVNGFSAWLLHGAMHQHGVSGHGHDHGHAHGHSHAHKNEHKAHENHAHTHDCDHDHAHGHDEAHEGHEHHEHVVPHDVELAHERGESLNIRGAWLHVLGDALASFAALVAAIVIHWGGPPIIDPLASFVVVGILSVGAVRLLRDAGRVLLEAAPQHLPPERIRKYLLEKHSISEVIDVRVWTLGSHTDAVTVKLRVKSDDLGRGTSLAKDLQEEFELGHVNVQLEAT